ncbi:MAG: heavy-metal-associated domain-containing protein [Bacteroidetes bacterium]|nr:heavy-metal-associated domain-containing protein [Bacteroidota bacterium]
MKTIKFKTNINCSGCVAKVTPILNNEKEIIKWEVDTNNPEKILSINTEIETPEKVIELITKAGFKIEEKH